MPDRFDFLKISYMDTTNEYRKVNCWFAYAPCYKIAVGDIVDTAFGRAVVLDKAISVSKDGSIFKLLDGTITIDRVLFRVEPVRYEDDV